LDFFARVSAEASLIACLAASDRKERFFAVDVVEDWDESAGAGEEVAAAVILMGVVPFGEVKVEIAAAVAFEGVVFDAAAGFLTK
jgi:hypothetical protein